ncbi:membrane protein insertion efficiency factor YidD [Aliidiomarina soli]|uniref:membrane protein insertion efficiency factor YidD n=1 Tax=Aliidiomarina soli TaxID=1928574 RepID=UPI0018E535B3|nr:membrane protein insertion efficiency factor YidD [Aliidiomarina soli]
MNAQQLLIRSIQAYQRSGGSRRWFGVCCNYAPTCSEYTLQAVRAFGARKGMMLGWKRIRRCRGHDSFCVCYEPFQPEQQSQSKNLSQEAASHVN